MSALDRVKFNATSTGTVAFVPASAVSGFLTPAGAAMVDGTPVPYTAQNPSDVTQWEYGYSVSASSGTSFARTPTRSSSGLAALCSFSNAPVVSFGPLSENEPCLSVALFGAIGDGSHDDTAALQAALNYAVINSITLYLNGGATYRLTSTLNLHNDISYGFGIMGNGATIRQDTSNVKIFSFGSTIQKGFVFDNFTLSYLVQQPITNTSAVAMYFETGSNNTTGMFLVFNSAFTNLRFLNAYRGLDQSGTGFTAFWGNRCENWYFDECTGAAIYMRNSAIDQPNNYFGNIYVQAQGMTPSSGEYTIALTNMSCISCDNFEVNTLNGNDFPCFLIEACAGADLRNFRVEGGTFNPFYQALFAISSCPDLIINYFEVAAITFTSTLGGNAFLFESFGVQTWELGQITIGGSTGNGLLIGIISSTSKGTTLPIDSSNGNTGYALDIFPDASLANVRFRPVWSGDFAVASLPTASVTWTGVRLSVNDALTPVDGSPVVGGGAVFVPVICNGVSWLADGCGPQGTPAAKTTSTTLTAAELLGGIITVNQGGGATSTLALPSATSMDSALPGWLANNYFDFSLINISTNALETASLGTASGWTLVGDMFVAANGATVAAVSSGRFRARKTAIGSPGTYTLYRIS